MFKNKLNTNDVFILGKSGPAISSGSKAIVPAGTISITENGTSIDVGQYKYADVAVQGSELEFRDKTIIPDTYNTGCKGYLTPFDLAGDTSGLKYNSSAGEYLELKFNTQYSSVIKNVDTSKGPIIYKNIDFTAYPVFRFMSCGDCHKEDSNYTPGVVIVFENCLFRKVQSNSSFTTADMIQFVFINCTMEYFNISNSVVYRCLIGNKTFYKAMYNDEVLEDGMGVNDYSQIVSSYVMDVEPEVSASGGAHFDGIQAATDHHDYIMYNVRFECMNMPYDPKGGGWTQAVNYEHDVTDSVMMYCMINGGGYYATGIRKASDQQFSDNLIGSTYNGPCYPSENVYQLSDGFASLNSNLYVTSCFYDGVDISIVCSNDISSEKTLTVIGYNTLNNTTETRTFTVPACPTYSSGWSGITSWNDLPFDKIYKFENASLYGVNKIECYDDNTKIRTWFVEVGEPVPFDITTFTSNGTYNVKDYSYATVNVSGSPTGTKQITANGTGIDVASYAYADVNVQPNLGTKSISANGTYNASSDSLDGYSQVKVDVAGSELDLRDKLIIPDKYNTGSRGHLDPFNLSGDTSGLLWQETNGDLKLDFNTASKQTIYNVDTTHPIIYENIDFTAYNSINIANANMCSKSDQYYKSGVVIIFNNCLFRKVDSNQPFTSQDMIQFAFMNCSMESFKLSNAYAENCLIGNRTFYKTKYGDIDAEDAIKLMSYVTIVNSYVMDVEPEPSTAGEAHYDGLQFSTNVDNTSLYNVRFECMNMPYDPKGGGWSYSIFYQALANNSYVNYCIFHGGGLYGTSIKKNSTLSLEGNLIGAGYSTPCYPGDNIYQLTDNGLDTYDTLLVSSVFIDQDSTLHIICTNDYTSAKTLTVRIYSVDGYTYTTQTFSIPACPSFNSGWSGITEWDDLPFDIDCTISYSYNVSKIECYDGQTKIRTWYNAKGVEPIPPTDKVKDINYRGLHDVTYYSSANVDGLLPTYIKNPIEFDYTNGYVDTNGKWYYQYPSNNYSDIYTVENGKTYRIMFGATVSTRARGCVTSTDVRTLPSGSEVQGTFVGTSSSVSAGNGFRFTSSVDGYLVFQKSNDATSGVQTYLLCIDEMTDAQPSGIKTITANGSGIDVAEYSEVNVNVPVPTPPSGKIYITQNGNDINVSQYALADVSVAGGGGTLPEYAEVVSVVVQADSNTLTLTYNSYNNKIPFMIVLVPTQIADVKYELVGCWFNYNPTDGDFTLISAVYNTYNMGRNVFIGSNAGSLVHDSTNHTLTFTTKSSTYITKAGDKYDMYVFYASTNQE